MERGLYCLLVLGFILALPGVRAGPDVPEPVKEAVRDAWHSSPVPLPPLPEQVQNEVNSAQQAAVAVPGGSGPTPGAAVPKLGDTPILLPTLALAGLALAGIAGAVGLSVFQGGARFITPAEVLENDVRQAIYAYLKERVGANLKQITDDLHLTTTNAIWHLRKLEEAGLLHSRRFNGYKVFYPADGGIEARRMSLGKTALTNENAQEVFQHVVTNPGTHQREIARAIGVNHGTVRWHLKKLLHAELIVETRRGKASSYEPTAMGLAALEKVTAHALAAPNAMPVPSVFAA